MGFQIDMPEDLMGHLFDYQFEEIAKEMIEEASPILVDSTKKALRGVVKHEGESEMINSVKATKPKVTKTDAVMSTVSPSGYSTHTFTRNGRKYPVPNAAKAVWLEYGVAGRQAPRPWLANIKRSEGEIANKMQEVFNKKVGGG